MSSTLTVSLPSVPSGCPLTIDEIYIDPMIDSAALRTPASWKVELQLQIHSRAQSHRSFWCREGRARKTKQETTTMRVRLDTSTSVHTSTNLGANSALLIRGAYKHAAQCARRGTLKVKKVFDKTRPANLNLLGRS